ncbi:pyridoxamine 5'-phosphate oxidase family protein [Lutibacter citreus]|uniref:pyridoxamine 5'-phosphate oxidase family protein n=1 Tax=Lutibacter citreus TaxID=2138210 RepID=UPI000DBE583B|nr:pyridoxamine 5'-phosphate oxidase family protein [Lutibacter citreus]
MKMPQEVIRLLNDNEATKVITSVSSKGIPHTIVVGSTMAPQEDLVCAAEILMQKTASNLKENPNVSVLAVKGMVSYQVVAKVKDHQTEGVIFDKVKADLEKKGLPCRGVWLFEPTEAYNQSAGPDAGKKIA